MKFQLKNPLSLLFLSLIICLFMQSCSSNQSGTLSVEAGLIYKAGDVKPVARTEFYLLDDSLETILKNAQIKSPIDTLTPLQSYAAMERGRHIDTSERELPAKTQAFFLEIENAIKPHIVGTMTTDFSGKGQFENVKPGKYYLIGANGTAQQAVVWNLPIEVKTGTQSITLDNKNSAIIL